MKIEELSYAINPGAHCDLFGAVMIAANRRFKNISCRNRRMYIL